MTLNSPSLRSTPRTLTVAAAVVGMALGSAACNKTTTPTDIPDDTAVGALRIQLASDNAGSEINPAVDEVWVRVSAVRAHHESEGWIELNEARLDVDLLAEGSSAELAREDVWTGAYDKIHIGIVDSWILVDGVESDLSFSGGVDPLGNFDAGVYVDESFFLDETLTTTLTVSWNLADNLDENGSGDWSLGNSTTATVAFD